MLINKTINILISFLILVSTSGITIDKHFHQNELFSISFFGEAESCCDGPCDCCHNEKESIIIKDNFISSSNFVLADVFPQYISLFNPEDLLINEYQDIFNEVCIRNRPPPLSAKKFKLLQVFRI